MLVIDHCNVIIHVLLYIPQEARAYEGHAAKRNADIIHPLVCVRKGDLRGRDDDVVRKGRVLERVGDGL